MADAREELAVEPAGDAREDMSRYVAALIRFLTRSAAGAAYRALVGEAQHDEAVAELVAGDDILINTARAAMSSARPSAPGSGGRDMMDQAATMLVGPVFLWIVSGRDPEMLSIDTIVDACLAVLGPASAG